MKKLLLTLCLIIFAKYFYCFETGKSPAKAAILSLTVPGGGQIYNQSYIKSGIFIVCEGYSLYMSVYNNGKMKDYKDKMNLFAPEDAEYHYYKQKYYDYHDAKQSSLWWIVFFTLLSTLDAYVDANMHNFDEKAKDIDIDLNEGKISLTYRF